jgi:hypothetical protein
VEIKIVTDGLHRGVARITANCSMEVLVEFFKSLGIEGWELGYEGKATRRPIMMHNGKTLYVGFGPAHRRDYVEFISKASLYAGRFEDDPT